MLLAKRLWLWHQAKEALKKAQAELHKVEEEQQQHNNKIADLEAKLSAMPPTASAEDEIAKMLLQQEIWVAKKEQERFLVEKEERFSPLEQSIHQRTYDIFQLEAELDEEEEALLQYNHLAERLANPVVEMRNQSCMGCFLPLSLSKLSEWRRGKGLVCCDECGRILV